MIKLRKYFNGRNRMYINRTTKVGGVALRVSSGSPEWVSEDIDLPKPVILHRQEWRDITGKVIAVTFNLSEIENDDTVRYGGWLCGCTVSSRDCIKGPIPGVETNPGPFFCLVVDGTEYWYDDVKENFARLQSRIGDYNTELYLKEMDEQGTV